jgi:hypothetical protein
LNGRADPPTPTQASITVTLSPNPATAEVCSPTPCLSTSGERFQFRLTGTITIQETAGVSGNVNSISLTIFNPAAVYGSDVIVQRSGTNHVTAKGMLIFPINIVFGAVGTNATHQFVTGTN